MTRAMLSMAVTAVILFVAASPAHAAMCANTPGGDVVSVAKTTCTEAHKVIRL
jgi:hypothetical protein